MGNHEFKLKKVTCHGALPAKILKHFCDSYLLIITKIINKSITEGTFPSELKLAEVTPVSKKLEKFMNKETYRPVSLFVPYVQGVWINPLQSP